ncbi:helix-turn-helix transcriptional regulator [Streptomyces roseolilacinus]|uniref:Helix-turn-helix transcriptional regulator n=1 Tax=Streptomyces roseolilacinus TaxID=66904 RepID=A0A918EJU5_9ACTN|nr:LuxR C-terminal-related transcriptional regulator [Streptomyces roseolilacinus]GGQ09484.1 helix-turn-helix transcriptional regulator [Streptomyces roseolilacinus]
MVATHESAGRPAPLRSLVDAGSGAVLVLVEGAAGMGKSHFLRGVGASPEAAGVTRLAWRCGDPDAQPEVVRQEGPLLLLVDDAHRAGAEERQRLRRVLEAPWPGLTAVVSYRPEELEVPGLPLGASPDGYPPELTVVRHRLEPWDAAGVRRAAAEVLGDHGPAEVVTRLWERSGGVPQVVVDLLALLRGRPLEEHTVDGLDGLGVPVRLAELALSRTLRLSPEDRPVVWAAAVLDEPVSRDELVAVSGLGPARGRSALLAALACAALAEREEGRYGLPVPLAALAVHASVPGPVRQELHQRAARAVARRQPVPWAVLARHHRAGGHVRGWLRAVENAARAAAGSGRHQEAIGLLEPTLTSPVVPPQVRARLAPLLARSAVVGLRSDQTVEVLRHIIRDASLPLAVRGELRLDLGLLLNNQLGRVRQGWRELELAAAELREVRPDLAARAMAALALPQWPGPSVEVHRTWLLTAVQVAEESEDDVIHAAVAANRLSFSLSVGDPEAWDLVESLPTDSPEPSCRLHAARGLCNAADSAAWLGYYPRAEEMLAAGLELSARNGAPYTEHTALGTRLLLEWYTGRWGGLAERCERFVDATADMPLLSSDARMVRGLVAFAQGDWGTALSWLSGDDATSPEDTPAPLAAATSGALVRLALARQEVGGAAERAREAWSVVAAKGVWGWAAELAPWAVEALARAGERETARHMVHAFALGIEGRDVPVARAALVWSQAVLAEVEGRWGEAVRLYRAASAAYAALPRPYAQALNAESAARCALETRGRDVPEGAGGGSRQGTGAEGPRTEEETGEGEGTDGVDDTTVWAVAELQACTERFSDLGAVWDAARCRAVLRTYQPAKDKRRPGRPSQADQLSPREREVAELAVSGLTNREIATTLHLSPRTVEQHIARAMRKTGALSRQDLPRHLV